MATQDDHHDYDEIGREIQSAKKYILILDDGNLTRAYMRGCNLDYAHMLSGLFDEHPHIYELMHAIKEARTLRDKMAEEMGEDEADRAIAVCSVPCSWTPLGTGARPPIRRPIAWRICCGNWDWITNNTNRPPGKGRGAIGVCYARSV